MASIIWTLGTYDFIAEGTVPHSMTISGGWRLNPVIIPQRDGSWVNSSTRPRPVPFNIIGTLLAATAAAARTSIDSLMAALGAGRQQLQVWDDRYMNVSVRDYRIEYSRAVNKGGLRMADFTIDLLGDEGVWLSDTLDTDSGTTDSTPSITNSGNAPTPPIITVTAPGGGLTQVIAQNTTTSKSLTWDGSLSSGDELVINMDTIVITEAGIEDYSGFSGLFWRLEAGVNALDLASTPTGASIDVTKRDRWF